TIAPGEPAHWFSVWLVVIDDQVYVRLGPRAAGRIEKNVAAPYVGVRILGQQFERVRAEPAPDHAERVAKAMAAKYWSDLVVHHFSHPPPLRLPRSQPATSSTTEPPARSRRGLQRFGGTSVVGAGHVRVGL